MARRIWLAKYGGRVSAVLGPAALTAVLRTAVATAIRSRLIGQEHP